MKMRTIGLGALGLVGGMLLALVVQDVVGGAFLQDGAVPTAVGIALGLLMPALGVLGLVAALVIDGRSATRRSRKTPER